MEDRIWELNKEINEMKIKIAKMEFKKKDVKSGLSTKQKCLIIADAVMTIPAYVMFWMMISSMISFWMYL